MARVLVGISNGLKNADGKYVPSGFMEQIIDALHKNGNDVFVYIPNLYHKYCFNSKNELLDNVNEQEIINDIKSFDPELIITFNNAIYKNILGITDCPIVIWGADKEHYWNQKEYIKKNVTRYHFFCFSKEEMKSRQEIFGIKDNKIHLMRTATNLVAGGLSQDKNISFIGTCFDMVPEFENLIHKYSGSDDIQKWIANFKKYLYHEGEILDGIDNADLISDFNKIPEQYYTRFFSGEKRFQTLLNVSDLGLYLYGNENWKEVSKFTPSLAACFCPQKIITAKQNQDIYNSSKICLNINHDQSIFGMNFRVCDVLATNGLLISSYSPFLKEQFKNISIPMFRDSFEARELCQEFLKDEKARQQIIKQSQDEINKNWRFENRFKEMEDILGVKLCNPYQDNKIIFPIPKFNTSTSSRIIFFKKKPISFKNRIRYKIWKHLDKKLKKKGIIK